MSTLGLKLSRLDWLGWLYGLLHGTIGGAASSALGWIGMSSAHGAGVDVPVLNWKALGILAVSGAVPSFLLYLKQSPLPELITETTTTLTVKETKTTEPAKPEPEETATKP